MSNYDNIKTPGHFRDSRPEDLTEEALAEEWFKARAFINAARARSKQRVFSRKMTVPKGKR